MRSSERKRYIEWKTTTTTATTTINCRSCMCTRRFQLNQMLTRTHRNIQLNFVFHIQLFILCTKIKCLLSFCWRALCFRLRLFCLSCKTFYVENANDTGLLVTNECFDTLFNAMCIQYTDFCLFKMLMTW